MRESELLARIASRANDLLRFPGVLVGPGDDCAVVRIGEESAGATSRAAFDLLLTVDQLVEGRHFNALGSTPDGATVDAIARKAIARSVSDIAAMGGVARFTLAAGALPDSFAHADDLCAALHKWGMRWGCPVVGGDIAIAPGALTLSVTVVGEPHGARGPVLRSGARPGDSLFVTGALGGSFASGRHLAFEPRIREGAWLCDALGDRLHAMIDLSDGLGRDAARIALASGARLEIDADAIPRHPGVADWPAAASEGEDYELLFAASGDVPASCPETGVPITRIGHVVEGAGCVIVDAAGAGHDARELGWDHQA